MRMRLPGLSAFSTFEAAARHQSFTRAAEELNVTPAAVSYLVRELEAQLKVKLFHRTKRAVNGFLERFPDVDVRVDMSKRPVDFARDDIDLAIRFGAGGYPGLHVERLISDKVFPICSPKLLKGPRALRQPRDLRHFTLIHVHWQAQGVTWPTWQMWMGAAGVTGVDTTRGIHFEESVMAIQAAIDGQGVALGDSSLTATDLAQERLARPFDLAIDAPAPFGYWIVMPPRTAEQPLVLAFRDWLRSEAAAMSETGRKPAGRKKA
jgi:LysR family glycine cleavage system transcriptional activator